MTSKVLEEIAHLFSRSAEKSNLWWKLETAGLRYRCKKTNKSDSHPFTFLTNGLMVSIYKMTSYDLSAQGGLLILWLLWECRFFHFSPQELIVLGLTISASTRWLSSDILYIVLLPIHRQGHLIHLDTILNLLKNDRRRYYWILSTRHS